MHFPPRLQLLPFFLPSTVGSSLSFDSYEPFFFCQSPQPCTGKCFLRLFLRSRLADARFISNQYRRDQRTPHAPATRMICDSSTLDARALIPVSAALAGLSVNRRQCQALDDHRRRRAQPLWQASRIRSPVLGRRLRHGCATELTLDLAPCSKKSTYGHCSRNA